MSNTNPSSIVQFIIQSNAQNNNYENVLNNISDLKKLIKSDERIELDNILNSYKVFACNIHKFSVPIFNWYQRNTPSSDIGFNKVLNFDLHNTDQFIADIVLNITIDGIGEDIPGPVLSYGSQNIPQYHYCAYPGVRLTKLSRFEIDGVLFEQYTPENTIMYRQFDLPTEMQQSWDICHGQEQPIDGYLYLADNQVKLKQTIYNGAQTPKTYQPPLDLWIKGNFFFNSMKTPLPVGQIYYKSRIISYILEDISKILFVRINGQSYGYGTPECVSAATSAGITLPAAPNITNVALYVNNIAMDPDIYELYKKKIGFMIIRPHYNTSTQTIAPVDSFKLSTLKYPTESIRFGFQPLSNDQRIDSWYKYTQVIPQAVQTPTYLISPVNTAPILSIGNIRYETIIPIIDSCAFHINGEDNKLYDYMPPIFYSAYSQTRSNLLFSPDDPGLMAISFNRSKINETTFDDSPLETTGYLDLTQIKNMYISWRSSYISTTNPVRIFIATKTIQILTLSYITDVGYKLKFFM